MIVIILSLIVLSLAILERVIYVKKDKNCPKVRLFIKILISILLISISYYITDTIIDIVYVILSFCVFILLQKTITKSNVKWYEYVAIIAEMILLTYVIINSPRHMLVYSRYIFCLLLLLVSILGYSSKKQRDIKENFKIILSILVSLVLVFSYYKLLGSGPKIMTKPEVVAEEFLDKKLGLTDVDIYLDIFERGLRGEEIFIKAYQGQEKLITMVYKDSKIIRYEIKDFLN